MHIIAYYISMPALQSNHDGINWHALRMEDCYDRHTVAGLQSGPYTLGGCTLASQALRCRYRATGEHAVYAGIVSSGQRHGIIFGPVAVSSEGTIPRPRYSEIVKHHVLARSSPYDDRRDVLSRPHKRHTRYNHDMSHWQQTVKGRSKRHERGEMGGTHYMQ